MTIDGEEREITPGRPRAHPAEPRAQPAAGQRPRADPLLLLRGRRRRRGPGRLHRALSAVARVLVTRRLPDGGLDPLVAPATSSSARADDTPFTHDELSRARRRRRRDRLPAHRPDRRRRARRRARPAGCAVVANVAVGYDNIDVAAATAARHRGVQHARRARRDHRRPRVPADPRRVAARVTTPKPTCAPAAGTGWGITQYLGRDVHGATLGLVGYGRIGQAVARRAAGLRHAGAAPHAHRHRRARATSPTSTSCSRESDIVSLHVPLAATRPGT